MGMILRIASSRIVGQGDIVGRSGYFSLNLSANSVMRGRLDARRTLKSLVADLRLTVLPHFEDSFHTFNFQCHIAYCLLVLQVIYFYISAVYHFYLRLVLHTVFSRKIRIFRIRVLS